MRDEVIVRGAEANSSARGVEDARWKLLLVAKELGRYDVRSLYVG